MAPGVRFNDCYFSEPTALADWQPPKSAGLFVILAQDPNWAPKPFQPLFFGEFGNNAAEPLPRHEWLAGPVGMHSLFVAALPMPFSTTAQRWAVRNELVWAYNPACQGLDAGNSPGELARKIGALEVKHEEQATQILALLASINRLFEPQPVSPHRPIGFLAEVASV
jgi:hypothetical protein